MLCHLLCCYLCIYCTYKNDWHHSSDLVRKKSQAGNVYLSLLCALSPEFLKERLSYNAEEFKKKKSTNAFFVLAKIQGSYEIFEH